MLSQRKIAEILGMPASTVANILNGTPRYKKETREKVLKAAAELGYRPNRASVALKRGRSNLIGIVHFSSAYEIAGKATLHLAQAVMEQGYDHLLVDMHWHHEQAERVLDEMIRARVEGVLLIGDTQRSFGPAYLKILEKAKIPVVSLQGDERRNVPLVGDSARHSFHALTQHLLKVGHRMLVMPVPHSTFRSVTGRMSGFRQAIEAYGTLHLLDEAPFYEKWPAMLRERRDREVIGVMVRYQHERPFDVADRFARFCDPLFADRLLPDALLCTNDYAALGVFDSAKRHGILIPEEMAITGSDDDRHGRFAMFSLTTIRMDIAGSAQAAVDLLCRLIRGETLEETEVELPAQLVLRRSCGRKIAPGKPETVMVPAPLLP
ncbi:MAG TPA: LacI family DNA-binding transcriptional regulator [Chthoniobacteraceae bacterium]|nr:LacI family DNA-binding transcriptional regulator [Chthoniobacteraceae bacterium]